LRGKRGRGGEEKEEVSWSLLLSLRFQPTQQGRGKGGKGKEVIQDQTKREGGERRKERK